MRCAAEPSTSSRTADGQRPGSAGLSRSGRAPSWPRGAGSPVDHALACLLGLLGLRISEALGIDVEDLALERGHRTVTVAGKGAKVAVIPLPPRVARAVDLAPATAAPARCCCPVVQGALHVRWAASGRP